MGTVVLVIEIVLCLFALFMIAVVLLQSGKSAGLSGDIAGGAEAFVGKAKAKSYEGTLKRLTKVAAVGMLILAIALVIIQVYFMPKDRAEPQTDESGNVIEQPADDIADDNTADATGDAADATE